MCYDDNARPPHPQAEGAAAHGEDIVLTAIDGTPFSAYIALPEGTAKAQILIYPDVRGLHQFYKELALRFAEVGITALAIDYFGRSAGLTSRDDSFDFWPHVQKMSMPTFLSDVTAAVNYLREGDGAHLPTFTVGFCRGGTLSFLTGTENLGFAGVIGFYAGLSRGIEGKGNVLEEASKVKYPVLGLFGGADQMISAEEREILDQELDKAGVEHTIIAYEGAPHSFFDRRSTEFADVSANAWQRMLEFIDSHRKVQVKS